MYQQGDEKGGPRINAARQRPRQMRPTWTSPLACVALVVLAGACEPQSGSGVNRPAARKPMVVALLGPAESHPQWAGIRGGAQRYAADVPTVRIVAAAADAPGREACAKAVRGVLSERPSAACVFIPEYGAEDAQAMTSVLDDLAAARMLLVTVGLRTDDTQVYGHVGVDWENAVAQLGDELQRVGRGRASFVLAHEDGVSPRGTTLYRRFTQSVVRTHSMTLLQARVGHDAASMATSIEELLSLFPNAGLVVTLSPEAWWRATPEWDRRLRAYNPTYRFATLSTAPALWPRLGTPAVPGDSAALVGPLDGELGYQAVQMAMRGLIGEQETSKINRVPCEIVTPDDLPDFARRYSQAAGGLDVPRYGGGPALNRAPAGTKP